MLHNEKKKGNYYVVRDYKVSLLTLYSQPITSGQIIKDSWHQYTSHVITRHLLKLTAVKPSQFQLSSIGRAGENFKLWNFKFQIVFRTCQSSGSLSLSFSIYWPGIELPDVLLWLNRSNPPQISTQVEGSSFPGSFAHRTITQPHATASRAPSSSRPPSPIKS